MPRVDGEHTHTHTHTLILFIDIVIYMLISYVISYTCDFATRVGGEHSMPPRHKLEPRYYNCEFYGCYGFYDCYNCGHVRIMVIIIMMMS